MFKRANEGGYSIPAFNFCNMEQLQAILEACVETDSDVILQISASARKYIGKELLPLMIKGAIEEIRAKGSKISVALNLDHGKEVDMIKECLDYGFSSVMIDASKYEFEKNVEITKSVVELAKEMGCSSKIVIGGAAINESFADEIGADGYSKDAADCVKLVDRLLEE